MSAPDHRPLPAQTGPPSDSERVSAERESVLARVPFYPLLVGFALVAGTYIDRDVSYGAVIRAMGIAVLLGAVLTGVFASLTRSWRFGALVAAVLLVVAHAGDLFHAIAGLALAGLIAILLAYLSRLRAWPFLPGSTRILNILATTLVAVLFVQALVGGLARRVLAEATADPASNVSEAPGLAPGAAPDIYLLMLEDYPRADSLQRLFGFDNSQFLGDLQGRGFDVATDSRASYTHTAFNLVSLFQMAYLADLPTMQDYEAGKTAQPSLRLMICFFSGRPARFQ